MKKILFLVMLTLSSGIATNAQEKKDKVKATETIPQKVHNTVSKNKKHKGYKKKHKANGVTHKKKVDVKNGDSKTKTTT